MGLGGEERQILARAIGEKTVFGRFMKCWHLNFSCTLRGLIFSCANLSCFPAQLSVLPRYRETKRGSVSVCLVAQQLRCYSHVAEPPCCVLSQ